MGVIAAAVEIDTLTGRLEVAGMPAQIIRTRAGAERALMSVGEVGTAEGAGPEQR